MQSSAEECDCENTNEDGDDTETDLTMISIHITRHIRSKNNIKLQYECITDQEMVGTAALRRADAACALTRWQHFSADVMDVIL